MFFLPRFSVSILRALRARNRGDAATWFDAEFGWSVRVLRLVAYQEMPMTIVGNFSCRRNGTGNPSSEIVKVKMSK